MSEQTIMERLKTETWPQHQQAERQDLEKELISGTLPKELFVEYLAQRYVIHQALEAHLQKAAEQEPRVKNLLAGGRRLHQPRIAQDLEFFGQDAAKAQPLEPTAAMIKEIGEVADKQPVALLGFFYVFEGSTNGARYIARAIRGAYRLQGADGTRYLDPYGEEQRPLWDDFKTTMNSYEFTPGEQEAIIEAARSTFTHMIDIDQAIHRLKSAG